MQVFHEGHPLIAFINSSIGLVYNRMGKFENAINEYKKCLDIYNQLLPADHPDIGEILAHLSRTYENLGDYENSLIYLNQCLIISKQILPEDHANLIKLKEDIKRIENYHHHENEKNKNDNLNFIIKNEELPKSEKPSKLCIII